MPDFTTFPKIDAHFHSTFYNPVYEKTAGECNLRYININTDAGVFPSMDEQEKVALDYIQKKPEHFAYISSFEMKDWGTAGWYESLFIRILKSIDDGAAGVKIWKNIGMELRKPDGAFLMIDDPFFAPFFKFVIEHRIPVLAHLGEPRNCWLPLDLMTSFRNRIYFANHPEYHAYLHPEIPSYEQQIDAMDRALGKYPELIFIGAHLGSMEWSCAELSKRFDRHPNFFVDLSSRVEHLQIQSNVGYDEVRHFMIQYADRIIYGTDAYDNPEKLKKALVYDWKYLSTANDCKSEDLPGTAKGLALPEEVLYQLYFDNAKRIYSRLKF